MPIRAFPDPERVEEIEAMPLEFNGIIGGHDESGQPHYGILFQPEGADPESLGPEDLLRVYLSREQAEELQASLIQMLTSVR